MENNTNFDNDILQPIPDDQLMIYYELCKAKLPNSLRGHLFLKIQYDWKVFVKRPENQRLRETMSPKCINNFFTHRDGNIKNCTFIAITDEGLNGQDYAIFPFSIQENHQELKECIRETKRIKWNISPLFISMQTEHIPIVRRILLERNLEVEFQIPNVSLWLPKEKAKQFEYVVPDHVYLANLKEEDTYVIEPIWPHRSDGADNFLRTTILLNGGLGVYEKQTNRLLSWVLKNDNYAPGSLQTLDSEKCKGYGKLVLKAFCKQFANDEDHDIIAFVNCVNTASRNLFYSLGFTEFGTGGSWLRVKKVT